MRGRNSLHYYRVCDLCAKSKIEGSTTIPRVADYALSHEFDDLRGEFSDLPVRSDDSDDSSESESSSADDSAVGYGESDSDISVGTLCPRACYLAQEGGRAPSRHPKTIATT